MLDMELRPLPRYPRLTYDMRESQSLAKVRLSLRKPGTPAARSVLGLRRW
ncbi:hypothetical protein AB7M29_004326 [Pseudomonas sp. F-14 TE3623]